MPKFRHRLSSARGTKLVRGHINDSNPQKRRHRDASAAARRAQMAPLIAVDDYEVPESSKHDEEMLEQLNMDSMSLGGPQSSSAASMISEGGFSRASRFTTLTNCTNPTFDVVNRSWKSGSHLHKDVLAVLATVAEIIKENDGNESDVEYFGALFTVLESIPPDQLQRAAATAYLLSVIVKKVPREVLQHQFKRTSASLTEALSEFGEGDTEGSALKYLITTFGYILRAQTANIWLDNNNRNILLLISSFCTHSKPRVRSMARSVVRTIITDPVSASENGLHPAASIIGEYIEEEIKSTLESKKGSTTALRFLCLLEGILHKMPAPRFKSLTENILRGFAYSEPQVKCAALQCLHRALERAPSDAALPVEVNRLLILTLRSLEPSPSEIAVCAFWMQTLVEAHICLPGTLHFDLLPETMQKITQLFQLGNTELCFVIVQVLTRLIEAYIKDDEDMSRQLLSYLDASLTAFSAVVWKYILKTMATLFQTAGVALCGEELVKALQTLARFRESESDALKQELDITVGAAVRYIGVEHVMDILPLNIDPTAPVLPVDFKRSWLLPVLRVNIKNAPLSLFLKHFMPLAMKLHRRVKGLEPTASRAYHIIQTQLWELMPSFLASSRDFESSFPLLAPILGSALNERPDLRLIVLSGIRSALRFCLDPSAPPERKETMAQFTKNFMPLFFNLYTSEEIDDSKSEDHAFRLSLLEAINAYVDVAPADRLRIYVENALVRFQEKLVYPPGEEVNKKSLKVKYAQRRRLFFDIIVALSKRVDANAVKAILDSIAPCFDNCNEHSMQKKAFRVLNEVLKRRAEPAIAELCNAAGSNLLQLFLMPYDKIAPPARGGHQDATARILPTLNNINELREFCLCSTDTTVRCLEKSNAMACRESASKLFQQMCNTLIEVGAENDLSPSDVLEPIISRVFEMCNPSANQAEIPLELARSCEVALNIVAQKFIKLLNSSHLSRLISHACSTLKDPRTGLRVLGIRLMRVLVTKMPSYVLQQYREIVLQAFFEQDMSSVTSQLRKANSILLDVFLQKFSVAVLEKMTERDEWRKQMRNLEKRRRRKARDAADEADTEDMDDDVVSAAGSKVSARTAGADTILHLLEDSDDEEEDKEEALERRSRVSNVWLKEDADGEVNDLLDTTALLKKVTTVDPSRAARREARLAERKQKNNGFAITKDGKLIIEDDSDDEPRSAKRRKKDDDDLADLFGKSTSEGSTKKKQEFSDDDSDTEEDKKSRVSRASTKFSQGRSTVSGYKPGGSGIHRDLSGSKTRPVAKATRKVGKKKKQPESNLEPYAYVPLKKLKTKKGAAGTNGQALQELRKAVGKRKHK